MTTSRKQGWINLAIKAISIVHNLYKRNQIVPNTAHSKTCLTIQNTYSNHHPAVIFAQDSNSSTEKHERRAYMTGLEMVNHIKKTQLDKPRYKSS